MPHLHSSFAHADVNPNPISQTSLNKAFFIPGKAGVIEAEYCAAQTPIATHSKVILVVCHPHPLYQGTMQNKVVHTLCKAANLAGIDALRFNFRGVGKSEGVYDNAVGECDDLRAVLQWIHEHHPETQVMLSGFSFGSFIAAKVAESDVKPVSLILIAPPVGRFDFDPIVIHAPCLVVQGTQDEVVDSAHVYEWVENKVSTFDYPITLEKMDTATHFFHGQLITLRTLVETFIVRQLKDLDHDIAK